MKLKISRVGIKGIAHWFSLYEHYRLAYIIHSVSTSLTINENLAKRSGVVISG